MERISIEDVRRSIRPSSLSDGNNYEVNKITIFQNGHVSFSYQNEYGGDYESQSGELRKNSKFRKMECIGSFYLNNY